MGMSLWGVILVALIDVGRPSVKVVVLSPGFGPGLYVKCRES